MGLVNEVFGEEDTLARLGAGCLGIGHVRYSTSGASELVNSQPLVVRYSEGTIALAHNGNLINIEALRRELEAQGSIFQTTLDTEVIASLVAKTGGDIVEAIKNTMGLIKGSYALVVMTKDRLAGAILRSQGGILGSEEAAELLVPYFAAVRDAGRQIAENGAITPETQLQLEADLIDQETYVQHANQSW
jgi:glutamine phosphoribosylpyrophosphate amidotransferase